MSAFSDVELRPDVQIGFHGIGYCMREVQHPFARFARLDRTVEPKLTESYQDFFAIWAANNTQGSIAIHYGLSAPAVGR